MVWRSKGPGGQTQRQLDMQRRAYAVLHQCRAEGQPPALLRAYAAFVDGAPELLALGPVPASLAMRVLYGLCSFTGTELADYRALIAAEIAIDAPTMRAMVRSNLLANTQNGAVATTAGKALYTRLANVGAFGRTESVLD